jgi:hypothetical protein
MGFPTRISGRSSCQKRNEACLTRIDRGDVPQTEQGAAFFAERPRPPGLGEAHGVRGLVGERCGCPFARRQPGPPGLAAVHQRGEPRICTHPNPDRRRSSAGAGAPALGVDHGVRAGKDGFDRTGPFHMERGMLFGIRKRAKRTVR